MKNITAIALLAFIFFGLAACTKNIDFKGYGREATIPFHGRLIASEEGFEIYFEEVVSDSRCPPRVECVWEGEATIKLQFNTSSKSTPFFLSTLPAGKDTLVEGHQVELLELKPASAPARHSLQQYKAVIKVSKI